MLPFDEMGLRLWLHTGVDGITRHYRAVMAAYDGISDAYDAARTMGTAAFPMLSGRLAGQLVSGTEKDISFYLDRLDALGADCTFEDDGTYPAMLKSLGSDAPPVLYFKGRMEPECALPIAVIGARSCTEYGKSVAYYFSAELAKHGAVIVSGLADGIDAQAARGALSCRDAALPTIGVTGCGIDVCYPAGNRSLYQAVAERGCVMTEFPPGASPRQEHFPMRNRIISGLSRGVLVVEAKEHSGTSITAGLALEQGRDVFAIPGRITDPCSAGTNRMIARGEAKAVLTPDDILQEYVQDLLRFAGGDMAPAGRQQPDFASFSPDMLTLVSTLLAGERSFEELADMTGFGAGMLSAMLTNLEFDGYLEQLPGRIYRLDALHYDWDGCPR